MEHDGTTNLQISSSWVWVRPCFPVFVDGWCYIFSTYSHFPVPEFVVTRCRKECSPFKDQNCIAADTNVKNCLLDFQICNIHGLEALRIQKGHPHVNPTYLSGQTFWDSMIWWCRGWRIRYRVSHQIDLLKLDPKRSKVGRHGAIVKLVSAQICWWGL